MKDKKKHGVFWFFKTLLTIALVIYTCVRCCAIASDRKYAHALDDSITSVTLTPAQTVALYGTQFNALVGDRYSNNTSSITFQYAFTLNSIGFMDVGGGFDQNRFVSQILSIADSSLSSQDIREKWCGSNGVVYVADSSQWNNSAFTPYDHGQMNGAVQLHIPFSVSLGGITRYEQNLFFSTKRNADYQTPYAYPQYNILTFLTDIANVQVPSVRAQYSNYFVAARAVLPTYQYYSDGNQLSENDLGYFSGWIMDIYESNDYDEYFQMTGQTIDCYCVSSVSRNNNNVWLVIGCPTIYGYTPPVVTTTRPVETIPAATYPVATMPPDSTDIPANIINQNLITNNYQLNLIIGQLNLIYNQLKLNGELNARLAAALDADNNPGLQFPDNTDIRHYMSEVFYQTGTEFVYSPEDLQSYTRAIPWLSSMLHGQTWFIPFAFLGTIGLLMIVFSYLVFRR